MKQTGSKIFSALQTLSIVGFVISTGILHQSCLKTAFFVRVSTSLRMNRTPLAVLYVSLYSACAGQCLLNKECRSFGLHWQKQRGLCSLYREDREFHANDLVDAEGYVYYDTGEMLDSQDKLAVPMCRTSEHRCLNEGCNDWCSHKQTCLPFLEKSCNDIRRNFGHYSLKSGYYTLSLLGQNYKVYCDMETTEGGWMLIGKVDINKPSDIQGIEKTTVNDILFQVNAGNFIPSPSTFRQLKEMFNATQLRMYCHKDITKKTLHIYTINNAKGRAVLEYLARNTNVPPTACGSFVPFPDDNSYLSQHCWEWGHSVRNKWWSQSFSAHAIAIVDKVHFTLVAGRSECDDFAGKGSYDFRGTWRIYQK